MLPAWLRLLRPHQWIKNGFVFIGLLFGHAWSDPQRFSAVLLAFAAFCAASSAIYILNDWRDREEDRHHPRKRHRPLASGQVSPRLAFVLLAVLVIISLGLGYLVSSALTGLVVAYLLLNTGYCLGWKHEVILDVFLIAAGFMLRILAGTLGVGIAPSQWLLLCGLLLTLFLGFAKRRAELELLAEGGKAHRAVLAHYSAGLLDQMLSVVASGVLVSYCLYTVSPETIALHHTPNLIYTVPFVLYGLFRYLYRLHQRGGGGDPSQELLGDRPLLLAVIGWLVVTISILVW